MLNGILDAMKSLIPARVELFHPLVVHFPVILLMGLGLIAGLVALKTCGQATWAENLFTSKALK